MILWTIQPEEVYHVIQKNGLYHCDLSKSSFSSDFTKAYDWLAMQMKKIMGNPPKGVKYPVWAWYMYEGQRKKPDLRKARWTNGFEGEKFVCMEIDIPENQVVLSDFDNWHFVLNNWIISWSEEEDNKLELLYNSLTSKERLAMLEENWKRVFDISYLHNDWVTRGISIQATFWELKKEQIKDVRFFTATKKKPNHMQG